MLAQTSTYQIVQIIPNLSGGHSDVEPPESIPNSEVKHVSADGSVGPPHARVGHRQAPITTETPAQKAGVFSFGQILLLECYIQIEFIGLLSSSLLKRYTRSPIAFN